MGNNPVASGSSAPVCPALAAPYSRFTRCSAELEVRPCGLSSKKTPSMRRPFCRRAMISPRRTAYSLQDGELFQSSSSNDVHDVCSRRNENEGLAQHEV